MSRSRRRCLVASAAICVLCASTAHAQTPAPERTVAAQGVASVKVVAPKDRTPRGADPRRRRGRRDQGTAARDGSRAREGHHVAGSRASRWAQSSRSPTPGLALRALRLLRHLRARSLLRHGSHRGDPDRQDDRQAQARRLPHAPHLPGAGDRHLVADRDLRDLPSRVRCERRAGPRGPRMPELLRIRRRKPSPIRSRSQPQRTTRAARRADSLPSVMLFAPRDVTSATRTTTPTPAAPPAAPARARSARRRPRGARRTARAAGPRGSARSADGRAARRPRG